MSPPSSAPTLSSNTRSRCPWCQSYCCPQYSWVYTVPFKRGRNGICIYLSFYLSSVECRCLDRETYHNFTQKYWVWLYHVGMLLLAELYVVWHLSRARTGWRMWGAKRAAYSLPWLISHCPTEITALLHWFRSRGRRGGVVLQHSLHCLGHHSRVQGY